MQKDTPESPETISRLLRLIEQERMASINGWLEMLDFLTVEKSGHSRRLARLTLFLSRKLGWPTEDVLRAGAGALLHDIGKTRIPREILHKKGPLDADERTVIRSHPVHGGRILRNHPTLDRLGLLVEQHHERWDGSGYPLGLSGEKIAKEALLIGLVDSYDAMTDQRHYNHPRTPGEALQEISRLSGMAYEPEMANILSRMDPEEIRTVLVDDTGKGEQEFLETLFRQDLSLECLLGEDLEMTWTMAKTGRNDPQKENSPPAFSGPGSRPSGGSDPPRSRN
ncbi:MAG: HD domain-containing protein [Nitrospirae bacterium]|jgi:putative nucleotidyltransferase with HDIG domain|nr:HD domain-containing protein [Nitrospirota bacterium]